jgi:hypothetical protein
MHHIICLRQILEKKNVSVVEQCISYFLDFEKAYASVRREVLYNVLIEFGIALKLVRLIKICLNCK